MKKVTLAVTAVALALTGSAFAAKPGTYVGLGLGGSRLNTDKQNLTASGSQTQNLGGVGGRVFTGYNFNQYVGAELGLATYAQSKYNASIKGVGNGTKKFNMNALDLVAKGYLPLSNSGFNLYGLAGLALVSSEIKVNQTGRVFVNQKGNSSTTTRKVRPVIGVGTSYDINNNVTTSLEYSHIQGTGNVKTSNSTIPNADMISLNMSYNFG